MIATGNTGEMVGTFLPGQLRIANEDSSLPGYCPACGAAVIRTHFDPTLLTSYDCEHWVDRCLSCGYGHEFKHRKDGKVEEWFQTPHKQPSYIEPIVDWRGAVVLQAGEQLPKE